jgi:hypothetical protein
VGPPRGAARPAMTAGTVDVSSLGAPGAVTPPSTTLSGKRREWRWGVRFISKKIFRMFHNFRIRVRHRRLEVSESDPTGEDHHDITGLQHHVGAGAPARRPRPGARRQRSCHRADRERPSGPDALTRPRGFARCRRLSRLTARAPRPHAAAPRSPRRDCHSLPADSTRARGHTAQC